MVPRKYLLQHLQHGTVQKMAAVKHRQKKCNQQYKPVGNIGAETTKMMRKYKNTSNWNSRFVSRLSLPAPMEARTQEADEKQEQSQEQEQQEASLSSVMLQPSQQRILLDRGHRRATAPEKNTPISTAQGGAKKTKQSGYVNNLARTGHEYIAGRPGGVSGYARAWYYRSVSRVRAPPSAYSYQFLGFFLVHKLTCGKRESVS